MVRFVLLAALAGCTAAAPPVLSQRLASPPTPVERPAPKLRLVEREMPDLLAMPPLPQRPAPPPRDDAVMRDCLALVATFEGYRRGAEPAGLRAMANRAIAIGGDCRLAADHVLGVRAARFERWRCGSSVYDDRNSAWNLAAAVATTPERRSAALHNRAVVMWNHASRLDASATQAWSATAVAFERAGAAAPGDRALAAAALDAWENALRTTHVSDPTRDDIERIAAGLRRSTSARAARLLETVPR